MSWNRDVREAVAKALIENRYGDEMQEIANQTALVANAMLNENKNALPMDEQEALLKAPIDWFPLFHHMLVDRVGISSKEAIVPFKGGFTVELTYGDEDISITRHIEDTVIVGHRHYLPIPLAVYKSETDDDHFMTLRASQKALTAEMQSTYAELMDRLGTYKTWREALDHWPKIRPFLEQHVPGYDETSDEEAVAELSDKLNLEQPPLSPEGDA